MTREEKFVVNPLIRWFKRQKVKRRLYRPRYGTAATGWDIEARRHNQDLLVEAKYIDGSFLTSFNGLVTAPLANRPQHFTMRGYRSWSYGICWAIGSNYAQRNIYQLLLDYFIRNLSFYEHYVHDLHMKYIFFVKNDKVAKISFPRILKASSRYRMTAVGKALKERRAVADKLMGRLLKFA